MANKHDRESLLHEGVLGRLLTYSVITASALGMMYKLGAGEFSIGAGNETPQQKYSQLVDVGNDVRNGEFDLEFFRDLVQENWHELSPKDQLQLLVAFPQELRDFYIEKPGVSAPEVVATVREVMLSPELLLQLPEIFGCDEVTLSYFTVSENGWADKVYRNKHWVMIHVFSDGKIEVMFHGPSAQMREFGYGDGSASYPQLSEVEQLLSIIDQLTADKKIVVSLTTNQENPAAELPETVTFANQQLVGEGVWSVRVQTQERPLQFSRQKKLYFLREQFPENKPKFTQRITFLSEEHVVSGEVVYTGPYLVGAEKIDESLPKGQLPQAALAQEFSRYESMALQSEE